MRKGKRCSLWVCMVCERYQTMVQASSNLWSRFWMTGLMEKLTNNLSDPSLFFWFVHGTCNLHYVDKK